MKKLIVVFGINGAGKTSVVKNLLLSDYAKDVDGDFLFDCFDFFEKSNKHGTYTLSKGGKFAAVGGYSNKCGGADSIKTVEDYFAMINFISEKYPDASICIEGVLQRAIGDLINCFTTLKNKGYEEHLIMLDTSLDEAVERVKNRNGHMPNVELIKNKIVNTGRLFQKLQDSKLFNCSVINTDNKNLDQVYKEFEKIVK